MLPLLFLVMPTPNSLLAGARPLFAAVGGRPHRRGLRLLSAVALLALTANFYSVAPLSWRAGE